MLDRSLRRVVSDISHLPLAAESQHAVKEAAHVGADTVKLGEHPKPTGKKAESAAKSQKS